MKVHDPGHRYTVDNYDSPRRSEQPLAFMKREGPEYPGNVGHHQGTNLQEVLRVLIDRIKYLHVQVPCPENAIILRHLRDALGELETRAARHHGLRLPIRLDIENAATCRSCGHIVCNHPREAR